MANQFYEDQNPNIQPRTGSPRLVVALTIPGFDPEHFDRQQQVHHRSTDHTSKPNIVISLEEGELVEVKIYVETADVDETRPSIEWVDVVSVSVPEVATS